MEPPINRMSATMERLDDHMMGPLLLRKDIPGRPHPVVGRW
jgi:hypothetical protein